MDRCLDVTSRWKTFVFVKSKPEISRDSAINLVAKHDGGMRRNSGRMSGGEQSVSFS